MRASKTSPVDAAPTGEGGRREGCIRRLGLVLLLLVAPWLLSCGGGSGSPAAAPPAPTRVPAQGDATTLDVAEWNLEWFGDTSYGPADEGVQQQNVRDVIAGVDCDLWSLEEVVSASAFRSLVNGLGGAYAGLLASDASVTNGSAYYSADEQKVAFLYKTSVASVQGAQVILTSSAYDFGGRPPLEVKLSVTLNGATNTVYVVCFHAKAYSDSESYQRRLNASTALKAYLDTVRSGDKVFVLGDYNDNLDASITSGQPSPYANFVADTAGYFAVTKVLSDARISTMVGYSSTIDHQIVTRELASAYVTGSGKAFRADQYIPEYASSTTDHLPVLTRWTLP